MHVGVFTEELLVASEAEGGGGEHCGRGRGRRPSELSLGGAPAPA